MYFSKELLAGISLACVGIAGMAYLFSRRNGPTSDDCAEQKNMKKDLEHHFELCKMRSIALEHQMADSIHSIQTSVKEQLLSDVKTKLNRLNETVAGLRRPVETITTAERITEEKPDGCNLGRLETRVRILEREVTKIKMYQFRELTSVELESGEGAASGVMSAAAENRSERTLNSPNAQSRQPSASPTPTGRPTVQTLPVPPPS